MLKKTLLLLCAAALLFTLAGVAAAADGYSGHYVSFAYDEEGKGKPVDNAHGFPAKYVAHFQVSDGGTYEALIFGALTTGTWRIMKTKKGNEFVGMTIEKTTDKQLKETYGTGQPAFMLVRSCSFLRMRWCIWKNAPGNWTWTRCLTRWKNILPAGNESSRSRFFVFAHGGGFSSLIYYHIPTF